MSRLSKALKVSHPRSPSLPALSPTDRRYARCLAGWRFTMLGAVTHAVPLDSTHQPKGRAVCGLISKDGRWYKSFHSYYGVSAPRRCLRCRERMESDRSVTTVSVGLALSTAPSA